LITAPRAGDLTVPRPTPVSRRGCRVEDWRRLALVPLFVLFCHAFSWRAGRALVTTALLALLARAGDPALPLAFDTFRFHGSSFQIALSCTALDVFFGSIPLLGERRRPLVRSLGFFAAYLLALSAINLARLALGFLLYGAGVSWFLAHELPSGLFYFAVFVWIACRRAQQGSG
jgi:exosortase/archaeosortase